MFKLENKTKMFSQRNAVRLKTNFVFPNGIIYNSGQTIFCLACEKAKKTKSVCVYLNEKLKVTACPQQCD